MGTEVTVGSAGVVRQVLVARRVGVVKGNGVRSARLLAAPGV